MSATDRKKPDRENGCCPEPTLHPSALATPSNALRNIARPCRLHCSSVTLKSSAPGCSTSSFQSSVLSVSRRQRSGIPIQLGMLHDRWDRQHFHACTHHKSPPRRRRVIRCSLDSEEMHPIIVYLHPHETHVPAPPSSFLPSASNGITR